MKLHIIAISTLKTGPERALVDDFAARMRRAGPHIGLRDVVEVELAAGGGKDAEADRLISRCPDGAQVCLLDERGKSHTSRSFSQMIGRLRDDGVRDLCFLIGGAAGHGAAAFARADSKIAFGVQTWPHKLVRVMLAEQLYRATTLLAGTPYHKD